MPSQGSAITTLQFRGMVSMQDRWSMDSDAINLPGFYWHFPAPAGKLAPRLVQVVEREGELVVLASTHRPQALAEMRGDFAGPLPDDVPPASNFASLDDN
jgi:hypothetical protein